MIIMYGGSFDPVHIGHTIVANEVYNTFTPERFIFMPAHQSPLKNHGTVASDEERLKMLELTTEALGFGEISQLEMNRTGKSYTYDTVLELKKHDDDIKIVIGTDQYVQLSKWYNIDKLKEIAQFIVVNRDTDVVPSNTTDLTIHIPRVDISSTLLRTRLKENEDVRFWMLDEVLSYVRKENIYED